MKIIIGIILSIAIIGCLCTPDIIAPKMSRSARPYNIACVVGIANYTLIAKAGDIYELSGLSALPSSTYSGITYGKKLIGGCHYDKYQFLIGKVSPDLLTLMLRLVANVSIPHR